MAEGSTSTAEVVVMPPTGKVSFQPDTGDQYFLFHPTEHSPRLKALTGSMWRSRTTPTGEAFRAAVSVEALHWLRDNIGPLRLAKDVHAWYQRATYLTSTGGYDDSPLFEYQKQAVGFLMTRDRAMLSLSPGLGKTLVSGFAASSIDVNKVLVVAPASLLYMWKAELKKWASAFPVYPAEQVWHKKVPANFTLPEAPEHYMHWIISNPETVVRKLDRFEAQKFDLIILDESILYKNRKAQRTKKLTELANKIPRIWLLTGAPATRMLDDLWAQFHLINPKAYSSYWRFAQEYCIVNETPWGSQVAANKLNAEEKIKERFADIYYARSQDEVLDIPDWLFEDVDCPMTKQQEADYTALKKDLVVKLQNEDANTTVRASSHLSLVIRLLQLASNPVLLGGQDTSGKWQQALDLMPHYPGPYIVWCNFIETAKQFTEKLREKGYTTAFMLGETDPQTRQEIVEQFQNGHLDTLVLGQAVGSFGLTLTKARTAIYLERTFDGNYFQSLHRFRRIGTTEHPVVLHLRSTTQLGNTTIDHAVHSMLDYRVAMIKNLTVGMLKEML